MTPKAIAEIAGLWTLVAASAVDWIPLVSGGLAAILSALLIGEWLGFWKRPSKKPNQGE